VRKHTKKMTRTPILERFGETLTKWACKLNNDGYDPIEVFEVFLTEMKKIEAEENEPDNIH